MRVGSLFTGIGGLDLGLQRAGFEIAWQVEIDPWCRALLGQHWPEVPKFGDIMLCGAHNLAPVDLLCGGFPCQDISSAGKQAGIDGERSGLWREQARIIGELKPRYVLVENVAALLYAVRRPNGHRRPAAIQRVLRDLAALGYNAVWRTCSAAEFGAPHLRRRIFIVAHLPGEHCGVRNNSPVAYPAGAGQQERHPTTRLCPESDAPGQSLANAHDDGRRQWARESEPESRSDRTPLSGEDGQRWPVADASCQGLQERYGDRPPAARPRAPADECGQGHAQSLLGGGADGFPSGLDAAALMLNKIFEDFPPSLDQIPHRWPAGPDQQQHAWEPARIVTTKLKHRTRRLKGLGNAALPQIAEAIGRGIQRHAALRRSLEADA